MNLAPLNNGVVFRKLFTDREVLIAFVKDLTGIEIEPETIEAEKQFSPPIGPLDFKIDVFVEDPKRRLILELQRVWYDYHDDRFFHYHNAAIIELQRSYRDYKLDRTVYTIVCLTNPDARGKSLITTTYHSVAEDGQTFTIYPHKLFLLNPNYINDQTPPGLRDWLELVRESIKHPSAPQINTARPIIHKATRLIEGDELTPQEFAIFKEEEGVTNKIKEIARSMLAKGFDIAVVSEITGLSLEEVEAIKQKSMVTERIWTN
jgi:hypothetical protein